MLPHLRSIPFAVVVLTAGGCVFERREALDEEVAISVEVAESIGAEAGSPSLEEAAGVAVRLFRESVATGDLALALALLDRDATFLDPFVGGGSTNVTLGELLVELRGRHAEDGWRWVTDSSTVTLLGQESALVLSELSLLEDGANGTTSEVAKLRETAVLLITDDGWRIRHLHRSLEPD